MPIVVALNHAKEALNVIQNLTSLIHYRQEHCFVLQQMQEDLGKFRKVFASMHRIRMGIRILQKSRGVLQKEMFLHRMHQQ